MRKLLNCRILGIHTAGDNTIRTMDDAEARGLPTLLFSHTSRKSGHKHTFNRL